MFNIVRELVKKTEKCRHLSDLDYELMRQYCILMDIEINEDKYKTVDNINNFFSKNKETE